MIRQMYKMGLLVAFLSVVIIVLVGACGGEAEPTPKATPTLAPSPTPAVTYATLEHPLGFTARYVDEWVVVRDTSKTGVEPFDIVLDRSGKISRVITPVVVFSARTKESDPIQQALQIVVGPRIIGSDGPVSSDQEFNIHLRLFTLVKAEFLDRVQEDKDGFPRFVSEIKSPNPLPGTQSETHIYDHFWITDTATWQVTCSTPSPPVPEAASICQDVLESFTLAR